MNIQYEEKRERIGKMLDRRCVIVKYGKVN